MIARDFLVSYWTSLASTKILLDMIKQVKSSLSNVTARRRREKRNVMMNISLLVQGDPLTTNAPSLALHFAREAVSQGHVLYRVFFYKDAVHLPNRLKSVPSDETDLQSEWQTFASDSGAELTVCIAAGQRRGIVEDDIAEGFSIVGLGQMIEAMFESDRTVTF